MILNANDPTETKAVGQEIQKKDTRIYKTTANNGIKLQISTLEFSNRQDFAQYSWTRYHNDVEIMSSFCIFPISIYKVSNAFQHIVELRLWHVLVLFHEILVD